jgi:hypothetical protein
MQAQLAEIVASASREAKASGAPQAQASVVVGSATTPVATDTGFVIAGAGADDAGTGDVTWSNPGNITADDGTLASASTTVGQKTHFLVADDFGFSIPSEAIIEGIEVRVQAARSGATARFEDLHLVKSSTIQTGYDGSSAEAVGPSLANFDFGGSSDLWSNTWAPSDINDSGFGTAFAFLNTFGTGSISVDAIWIKVYYATARQASGALQAQTAVISGASLRTALASGTPQAQDAVMTGAASRTALASGTPQAQASTVSGSAGQAGRLASGALQAVAATVVGAAKRGLSATGALRALAVRVVGIVNVGTPEITDTTNIQLPIDYQMSGQPQGQKEDSLTLRGKTARHFRRMLKF